MTAITFINPNSTQSMTRAVVDSALLVTPNAKIKGWTSLDGPPAIQGREDGEAATPPLLSMIENAEDTDVIVIACFDDTALAEAKKNAPCPVIGIGEASYHAVALLGLRFSVVTTLDVSVPILEENISRLGFGHLLGRVRASNIPVLDLEDDPKASFEIIAREAKRAVSEDKAEAIVLGCAGMTGLAQYLRNELDVVIIDGVEAAAHLGLAMAGLAKSR